MNTIKSSVYATSVRIGRNCFVVSGYLVRLAFKLFVPVGALPASFTLFVQRNQNIYTAGKINITHIITTNQQLSKKNKPEIQRCLVFGAPLL